MTKARSIVVGLIAGLGLLSACTGSSAPSSTTPGGVESPGASAPASPSETTAAPASGACANPYQPVAEGDTWTYSMSGTGAGGGYTDTITVVTEDAFTVTSDFGGLTKDTKWACRPDGLVALQYGGGASGSLTSQNLSASFRTTKVSGVTLPPSIGAGDRWGQSYALEGTIDAGGAKASATGSVTEVFAAGKTVPVTVPAGTFDAIAIDTTITLDLQTSIAGVQTPISVSFEGTTYFADGVGMVKSTSDTSLFGQRIDSTIELTDYSVS